MGTMLPSVPFAAHANLETCLAYHEPERWPAHVIAAARAGAFASDCSPAEWSQRLDALDRAILSVAKQG